MAGVALHRLIIENTVTDGRDQSHLSVLHVSASQQVPDRTEFLLGRELGDPGAAMGRLLAPFIRAVGSAEEPAVVGVPCNTFHAPAVLASFFAELASRQESWTFANMVELAVAAVLELPGARGGVGVLSTTGTRQTGIYSQALEKAGARVLQVSQTEQAALHESIYDTDWGLKAVSPPSATAIERVESFAHSLVRRGARVLVPGCTELPLVLSATSFAGVPVVDPVRVLARTLVRRAGGTLTSSP